jgi:hypothetical protein
MLERMRSMRARCRCASSHRNLFATCTGHSIHFIDKSASAEVDRTRIGQLGWPLIAAFTRAGVNGTLRSRTPTASWTTLASAAPTGVQVASPAPSGG